MKYLLVSVWHWNVRHIGIGATLMFWSWHCHVDMSILPIFCHDILIGSDIPADTRRWSGVGLMLAHRLRFRASICPALFRRLVFAGIPVFMGHCMGYSVATFAWHWIIVLCFSGRILVYDFIHFPVSTDHSCGIGAMLVQCRRRWAGVV